MTTDQRHDDLALIVPEGNYVALRLMEDGRVIGVSQLLFHWTMHVDIHEMGYEDRYCFETLELAMQAFNNWDGTGDPEGWHRHPKTGRRRDLQTGKEWIEW